MPLRLVFLVLSLVLGGCALASPSSAAEFLPVPAACELACEHVLGAVKPGSQALFCWQRFLADGEQVQLPAPGTDKAIGEAKRWLRLVLRPQWVPEDLDRFVTCSARAIAGQGPTPWAAPARYDAVGLRYSGSGTSIQMVQTSYMVAAVIAPQELSPELRSDADDLARIRRLVETYLQQAQEVTRISLTQCRRANGVSVGVPQPVLADWSDNRWYKTVFWFSDQHALAFTCAKLDGGPTIDGPRLPDWFR